MDRKHNRNKIKYIPSVMVQILLEIRVPTWNSALGESCGERGEDISSLKSRRIEIYIYKQGLTRVVSVLNTRRRKKCRCDDFPIGKERYNNKKEKTNLFHLLIHY